MKIYKATILFTIFCCFKLLAQQNNFPTSNYVEVALGQSSDNSYTKGEGAQFLATFPSNDTISKSIQANLYLGLGYVWERQDFIGKFEGNYEIQKNTLVENEQDVQQLGFTYSAQIISLIPIKSPAGVPANPSNMQGRINYSLSASIKYSYDNIKNDGGIQSIIGFTFNRLRHKNGNMDKLYFLNTLEKFPKNGLLSKIIQFSHNHNFGLGYIDIERITLVNFDFQVTAYPLSQILKSTFLQDKLVFASYDYNSRGLLRGDTSDDIRSLRTLTFGSEYEISEKSSIQLSYNIIKGANPYKGLAYQDYSTLLIKFKFTVDTK